MIAARLCARVPGRSQGCLAVVASRARDGQVFRQRLVDRASLGLRDLPDDVHNPANRTPITTIADVILFKPIPAITNHIASLATALSAWCTSGLSTPSPPGFSHMTGRRDPAGCRRVPPPSAPGSYSSPRYSRYQSMISRSRCTLCHGFPPRFMPWNSSG